MKYEDFYLETKWEKEIVAESRRTFNSILYYFGYFVIFFLVVIAVLIVFFQKDDSSLQICQKITINSLTMKVLSGIASAIGILISVSVIPPIKKWYTPNELYYRAAAAKIIDDLESNKKISKEQQQNLLNIADKHLGALESGERKADSKTKLAKACAEMAKIIKDFDSNSAT
jgi:hypothetical protein